MDSKIILNQFLESPLLDEIEGINKEELKEPSFNKRYSSDVVNIIGHAILLLNEGFSEEIVAKRLIKMLN